MMTIRSVRSPVGYAWRVLRSTDPLYILGGVIGVALAGAMIAVAQIMANRAIVR